MTETASDLRLLPNAPEAPPDPLIGVTLDGRYRIEKVLGQGGMGLVYKATHVVLNKALAIKVLRSEVTRDEQVLTRFQREAQSASAIGSPHICDVSDFGTLPDGATYFVMEFLNGPSLSGAIEEQRPMETNRILHVARQLCDALGAAHERGIVHRDLKPDNVHLVKQGNKKDFVKVLDFGIAKVGGAADKKLTQAGQVFGTPHYMSPEQCAGRDVDHRTDIYAVGVMLYEMACGQVPFDADNLMGILTKHVYEQPIPPRNIPPPVNVPPGLEAIILKALAKQPDQRYQSMYELKSDLDLLVEGGTPLALMESIDPAGLSVTASMIGAAHGINISTPSLQMTPATPGVVEEPKSRAGLIIGAILGLLVIGAGVFAGVFFFLDLGGQQQQATNERPTVANPPVETPEPPPVVNPEPPPVQPEQPAAPTMVALTTDPPGAEVYGGDGSLIGNTPLELEQPPRGETLNVTLRAPGYQDRTFTVSHLTSRNVTVNLERAVVAVRNPRGPRQPTGPIVNSPTPQPFGGGGHTSAPPPRQSTVGSEIINPF
jgi:tRNA A-37 threonylcarbamoyl transferase component Bud32